MSSTFDVAIVGGGVAGCFAALKIVEKYPRIKAIMIDLGASQGKRSRSIERFMGSSILSDGKIRTTDLQQVISATTARKANSANNWVFEVLKEINPMKLIKDSSPSISLQKKISSLGFDLTTNSYYQWKPESIHMLSKHISERLETCSNMKFSFNNEVFDIVKKRNNFIITTANGEITAKNIILCAGRSGWRWSTELYKKLGLTVEDDYATFGVRVELNAQYLKDFNKSHCLLTREDLTLGPFSWGGTVIPEDHADVAISNFRSNEERWKSNKVSFSLLGKRLFKDQGTYQTDRLAKLAYLLFNDRVNKERVKLFMKGKSELSLLPEYNWLLETFKEVETIVPDIISKGNMYVPEILPICAKPILDKNLESEISGLYIAGESATLKGIMAAAISGTIAADSVCK